VLEPGLEQQRGHAALVQRGQHVDDPAHAAGERRIDHGLLAERLVALQQRVDLLADRGHRLPVGARVEAADDALLDRVGEHLVEDPGEALARAEQDALVRFALERLAQHLGRAADELVLLHADAALVALRGHAALGRAAAVVAVDPLGLLEPVAEALEQARVVAVEQEDRPAVRGPDLRRERLDRRPGGDEHAVVQRARQADDVEQLGGAADEDRERVSALGPAVVEVAVQLLAGARDVLAQRHVPLVAELLLALDGARGLVEQRVDRRAPVGGRGEVGLGSRFR
jgi:hypothetical protein